jgi:hypothetical protein
MKERYDAIVKELKEKPEVFHKDGGAYFIEFMPLIEKALKEEKVSEKPKKAPQPPKMNKTEEGLVKSMEAAVKATKKSSSKVRLKGKRK